MVASRRTFYGTLRAMLNVIDKPLLTDCFPPSDPHNVGARLLRHGLAVSAFSSLERYVGSRFEALLSRMQGSPIVYSDLPDELKEFITRDAVSGLMTRVAFSEKPLRQSMFDAEILRISGYQSTPPTYTAFGFSPKGSNVGHDDIKTALKAFGLKDPWAHLRAITSTIGASRVSLVDDYKNLAKTRHQSAHDPESNVPSADLKTHVETSILIGIAVDVLSCAVGDVYLQAKSFTAARRRLDALAHTFRFLDQEPAGTIVERTSPSGKAIKRYNNEADAETGALGRSKPEHIILRSPHGVPIGLCGPT